MKKVLIVLISLLFLFGCNKKDEKEIIKEEKYDFNIGYASNLINDNDINYMKKVFKDFKISNSDLFFKLLSEFNKVQDEKCGLKDWVKTEELKYDDFSCIDNYEKVNKISDGNCRITAYTLIKDKLEFNNKKNKSGDYLMLDNDVIENNDNYKIVKDNYDEFVTLFDEIDVSDINENELKNVYINNWNKYGIKIKDDKVSLISIVIHDKDFKLLFIGHTGILINLGDKYLFIEKIAFEEPYQFNIIKDINDLKNIFMSRVNYFSGEKDEKGPFVYQNNKLLYELK